MSFPLIKVCGMRDVQNIEQIASLCPDFLGFIFYPRSKRYVRQSDLSTEDLDKLLPKNLPTSIKRVGVFVESPNVEVEKIVKQWKLDFVQLHGNESPIFCKKLKGKGIKIIKVFSIGKEGISIPMMREYEDFVDYFLFDTQTPEYGGSGNKFDWDTLKTYNLETPFMLSGGISLEDVEKLKGYIHHKCIGFDVNSKFESTPAYKNPVLVEEFINLMKE
ncbi:phosphoribosylanthranilate isomerase [Bernardetia litoralis DSM 6794]|uniref:N-(5'-phosphoribosyl)anthranilate isomerase n=1 Tax=Bernardetia litoralis (strain ATCC 23117 / DSM 6794 / NBRC 15988 / NCIMB 1366 / Fx l1 / Sio-4) TaxID=880071 RepID=I4APX5_BERLS|nr:phosphoribosylanthranilate isomerase [Bernardetia litoralis]AFM06010.1 phosphoribosylanthranilate isomerase [Bernardetia litoralis DSM 6794]